MELLGLINLILNVTGVLLWVRWREEMLLSSRRAGRGTLLGTLKKAAGAPVSRWGWLGVLAGLVVVRALGYWQMGSAVRWTPSIDLGAIVISFRSDLLGRMLWFSVCSMGVFIAAFYFWLYLISAANRKVSDSDPLQNRVRAHLGGVERWPAGLKLLLPFLLTAMLWVVLGQLLPWLGYPMPKCTLRQTLQQAPIFGLAGFLTWKYLIAGLLVLHLVSSYVFLGNAPFWSFVNVTSRNLLRPIGWLPLRVGRIDLTPLVGAALVLFLGELAARGLPHLYERLLHA